MGLEYFPWSCRLACANGPHGLVGNGYAVNGSRSLAGKAACDLAQEHSAQLIRLALFQGLAHAEHDLEVMSQGKVYLGGDEIVCFLEDVTALGMPHKRPCAACVVDHGRSNLACECPLLRGIEVLDAGLEGTLGNSGHAIKAGCRGEDDDVPSRSRAFLQGSGHVAGNCLSLRTRLVHFPVGSDNGFHTFITPWRKAHALPIAVNRTPFIKSSSVGIPAS